MKMKEYTGEAICLILMLCLFYEGIYQIANWPSYKSWLSYAPLLKQISDVLALFVPGSLLILSCLLLFRKYRKVSLTIFIIIELIFIGWIASVYLFTGYLFWPYNALWDNPIWQQKMYQALAECWIAWLAILITPSETIRTKINKTNSAQIGSC